MKKSRKQIRAIKAKQRAKAKSRFKKEREAGAVSTTEHSNFLGDETKGPGAGSGSII